MKKDFLREKYIVKRKNLSRKNYEFFSSKILENFIDFFERIDFKSAHIYLSENKYLKEVDTWKILSYLMHSQTITCAPRVSGNDLENIKITQHLHFNKNKWGILEPTGHNTIPVTDIDLFVLPLLAYSKDGDRVGYGKGFYDRFLSKANKKAFKVGLSFFEPEEYIEEINKDDIKLDYCITPYVIHTFKS